MMKWHKGPPAFDVLTCAKGHKPRFYMPRNDNPLDLNWGWKRACADFKTANLEVSGGAEAPAKTNAGSPSAGPYGSASWRRRPLKGSKDGR